MNKRLHRRQELVHAIVQRRKEKGVCVVKKKKRKKLKTCVGRYDAAVCTSNEQHVSSLLKKARTVMLTGGNSRPTRVTPSPSKGYPTQYINPPIPAFFIGPFPWHLPTHLTISININPCSFPPRFKTTTPFYNSVQGMYNCSAFGVNFIRLPQG
jgi:hypothetical protein